MKRINLSTENLILAQELLNCSKNICYETLIDSWPNDFIEFL